MNIRKNLYLSAAFIGALSITSCSSDDDAVSNSEPDNNYTSQYVITADDSENSYLLHTSSIEEGSISALGNNGRQVIGTPTWQFFKDIAAYSFVYRKGDPGTTRSFSLAEENGFNDRSEIDLQVSAQSRAIVGDELYLEYSSRNYEEPEAIFYKINGLTENVSSPVTINTQELANNGEFAYITAIQEYKENVLVGFRTIKGGANGGSAFESDFNDHTYIAVFNRDLELQKVIEDTGRTGMISGQWRATGETGIEPVENGDVYAFSSALDAEEVPSGILKMNDGDLSFDEDYFFNISEASGGYKLYRTYYVGENKFVLQMFTEPGTSSASPDDTRNKFAVVNVVDQTFDWVSGVPENIASIGTPYIDKDKDEVIFPIQNNTNPHLYIIDANTATMKEGIEVIAEGISAVGKLSVQ